MYTGNKSKLYLVDPSWFKIYDENMRFLSDQSMPSTINKCKSHTNTILYLSREEKRRIEYKKL